MARSWDRPLVRFTGLRSGRHRYIEGEEAQLVVVEYVDGEAYATFLDAEDEDAGITVPVADMTGRFERVG